MGKICPKYKAALIQGVIAHTGAGSPEDIEFVNYNTKWQIKELEDLISCDFERCLWWDEEGNCCAILMIAKGIDNIFTWGAKGVAY